MIYIVEGPDGGGKTTLCQDLSKMTGFPIIHRSNPKTEEEKKEMMGMYVDCIRQEKNAIFDRAWYSEMVYGPVMRDKSYVTKEQMLGLERMALNNGGAMIIHCTDNVEMLWARCQKRGETYIKGVEVLDIIKAGFENIMHRTHHILPVLRYELSKQKMS